MEDFEKHLKRSDFTPIYMPALCVYIVYTRKFAYFQVSHTNLHSPESDNKPVQLFYTQMRGSCLALCIGQHSQPSVCMTVREWIWEKVSALLQELVGLSKFTLMFCALTSALTDG